MSSEILKQLLTVSYQLASNRELDSLLTYAMDMMLKLFGAEFGYLILLDDNQKLDFRVRQDAHGNEVAMPEQQISRTIFDKVIGDQEPLILADAIINPNFNSHLSVLNLQVRSVMCVPLVAHSEVLGALYLENRSASNVFDKENLEHLSLFAAQTAVAIENALLNEQLEYRVAQRTAELQTVNQALTEEVAELDAFSHTVAHDLRGPLAVLGGYARLFQQSLDADAMPPEQLDIIAKTIEATSQRLSNIVDELLLLATVRKGEANTVPMDMGSVVMMAQERLDSLIAQQKGTLIVPNKWPIALGYESWIEEVWVNYLSNGLKYGGQEPCLTLGFDELEDGMIRFWVEDQGPGIAEEMLDLLFVEFTRLNQTRAEGYGLGLSIVKRIVEKLGGRVGVRSTVGIGSCFYFTLPAAIK